MPEDILDGENPFEGLSGRDLTVLRLIVRQEVKAGVADAIHSSRQDQQDLEMIVCGSPSSPSSGLTSRVQILETKATLAQWLAGLSLGASISAIAGLLISILTHQIRL